MKKIIKFIVNFLSRFLPQEEIQVDKEHSETKTFSLLRGFERLRIDIKEKDIACHLSFSDDPGLCLCQTKDIVTKADIDNPKKNANIFAEFYFANGTNEPLLYFWIGDDKCILESVRSISKEERTLFKKAMPLNFTEKDPVQAFLLFSHKINILIDIKEKTEKAQEINQREREKAICLGKLKSEQPIPVVNELNRINMVINKLKVNYNNKFGYTYSV